MRLNTEPIYDDPLSAAEIETLLDSGTDIESALDQDESIFDEMSF